MPCLGDQHAFQELYHRHKEATGCDI
jgi:hypothetical protein